MGIRFWLSKEQLIYKFYQDPQRKDNDGITLLVES